MYNVFKSLLVALTFSGVVVLHASAQTTNDLMSPAQILAASQAIPNEKIRNSLVAWVRACNTQRWGDCHVKWWNMIKEGSITQIENDNFSGWGFIGQPPANNVLAHMIATFDNPRLRPIWDLDVKTQGVVEGLPTIIDGRSALTNGADHAIVLSMLEHNLRHFNIDYDMRKEMSIPSAEWLRLLSMMLASQGHTAASYEVLHHLHIYVKNNATDATIYNATILAARNLSTQIQRGRR